MLYSRFEIAFVFIFLLLIALDLFSYFVNAELSSCISYDSSKREITIDCGAANLTEIDNQLKDSTILHKETQDGIWLLNAGLVVSEDATLHINSSDVSWLKMEAPGNDALEDGENANGLVVFGSLKIDSVKITSWNQSTNDYAKNPGNRDLSENRVEKGSLRPFISVESDAVGTTDITNSELAYLGYEGGVNGGPVVGITYFGGGGSIIKNNDIHNLYFGFYSNGVGNITIENNAIHNNGHYGLDPHTGTHDMLIRNNTVYDNGGLGIICSLDCYNIIIENNTVYNNTKMGVMFSRNMYDSVARNNIIAHEEKGIVISESHNNSVYNNHVSDNSRGIDLDEESFGNAIHHNVIENISDPSEALHIEEGAAANNTLYSNKPISFDRQ
jgi:mannuronan 5-epimerase